MKNIEDYCELLKPDEICEILRISKHSFYKRVWEGQIPIIRVGKSLRMKKEHLLNYLDDNTTDLYNKTNVNMG